MRKIAVAITKGGTGKSTTVCSLAHGLAMRGKSVLIVDLDTQGQLSDFFGVSPDKGVADLLLDKATPEEALSKARENIYLLAGGIDLGGVKSDIARKDFRAEHTLAEGLQFFEGKFDYVILDTAPGWDNLSINAFFYAQEILSPVSLEALSLKGLISFVQSLDRIREYNPDSELRYILPTFLDRRVKKSEELLASLTAHFGDRVCDAIRYNVKISESPAFGKTIFEFDNSSKGAQDYSKLTERILEDG